MLIRKLYGRVQEEAGDDGAAGGGGAGNGADDAGGTPAGGEPSAGAKGAAGGEPSGKKPGMTEKEHELLREVMDKKAKLKEAEARADEAAKKLKEYEGINLEEVRALMAQKAEAEQKELEARGEFDKVKAQMRDAHQAEVKTLQQRIDDLSNQLKGRDHTIDELSIGQAFASSKFIAEKLVLPPSKARTVFGSHFERDDRGRIVAYDKPKGESNRAPLVNADGDPLGFEEALAKLVERDPDKDQILRASIRTGAGSGTTGQAGPGTPAEEPTGVSRISTALASGALKKTAMRLAK